MLLTSASILVLRIVWGYPNMIFSTTEMFRYSVRYRSHDIGKCQFFFSSTDKKYYVSYVNRSEKSNFIYYILFRFTDRSSPFSSSDGMSR